MKRFFVAAAAVGLLAGLGAQTWGAYAPCTGEYAGFFCNWKSPVSCWSINQGPDDTPSKCKEDYDNCVAYGYLYTSVPESGTGAGAKCEGGTWAGKGNNPNFDGGFCYWPNGESGGPECWPNMTQEKLDDCKANGSYYTNVPESGQGAGKKCEGGTWAGGKNPDDLANQVNCYYGPKQDDGTGGCWPADNAAECEANYGTVVDDCNNITVKIQYCRWETGCYSMMNPSAPDPDNPGMTVLENCKTNGYVYEDVPASGQGDGKQCEGGTWTGEGKGTPPGDVKVMYNNVPGAKANLKVAYAKNRVTVNWTPSAKVASGTVQLLNVKGVAVSTAFIKANSGKVSVKLGTVGVPAGMYFVHINAVGQNGKKIVTNSAISIVK